MENDLLDNKINYLQEKIKIVTNNQIIDKYNNLVLEQQKFIEYNNEIIMYKNEYERSVGQMMELQTHIDQFSEDIKKYNDVKMDIDNNNMINNKINKIIKNYNDAYNKYQIVDYNMIFGMINNIDNLMDKYINEIENAYESIDIIHENEKTMNILSTIDDKINKLKSDLIINNNDLTVVMYNNLQDEIIKYTEYNDKINTIKQKIGELEIAKIHINNELQELQIINSNYEKSRDAIENNKLINKQILDIKNNIQDITMQMNEINIIITKQSNEKLTLEKMLIDISKTTNDINEIKVELDVYEILSKLTCRDGVQLYLLSEYLENITNKVNSILEPFINKTINLALHNDTIELTILSKNENIIHTISGMESFMLDLVFKIIIGHISVIPKSNVIFMDESISVLDKHRLASIDELFSFLKQYYESVYLITHMKQVNNHINNSIEIIKNSEYSHICNYNSDIQLRRVIEI